MLQQECCICDEMFTETEDNPGAICPECRKTYNIISDSKTKPKSRRKRNAKKNS